jgi:hypothetical protein
MIIPIGEARKILRISSNTFDVEIKALLAAIPSYLEETTGYTYTDNPSPMAKTVAGFLLKLWFFSSDEETEQLKRTINNLLTVLTVTVDRSNSN